MPFRQRSSNRDIAKRITQSIPHRHNFQAILIAALTLFYWTLIFSVIKSVRYEWDLLVGGQIDRLHLGLLISPMFTPVAGRLAS